MIGEIKIIKMIKDFFSRSFHSRKEKKERDASLLQDSYNLLSELKQSWELPQSERLDLVDYTNLLLQKAHEVKIRKNKPLARHLLLFAKRNCLAGSIPDSEIKRVHQETEELLERMKKELGINEIN